MELLTSGVYIKEFDWAELQICVTSPYGVRAITAKKKGVIGLWLKRIVVVSPIQRIELSPGELPSGESNGLKNDK